MKTTNKLMLKKRPNDVGGVSPQTKRDGKKKKERILVELNGEAQDLINNLMERTLSTTRAELFRNLLRFSAMTLDEIDDGSQFLIQDKDGKIFKSKIHEYVFFNKY